MNLEDLQHTLPPYVEGRDRLVLFEADGSIRYPQETGEPPREINGYERVGDWSFRPLWPPCALRHGVAIRLALCGCIDIIMRCNNPRCPKFADRVKHTDCLVCPLRNP
jgi:hypothetical protein